MMKCHDCGAEFEYVYTREVRRSDVCNECWENREWLVKMAVKIPRETLRDIQRAMANGRGTARRKIEALKKQLKGE